MVFNIIINKGENININYSDVLFINVYSEIKCMRFYIKKSIESSMDDIGCNYIDYNILKHFSSIGISQNCTYINLNNINRVRIEDTYIAISYNRLSFGISYSNDYISFLRAVKLKNIENFLSDNQHIIEII